MAAHLIRPLIFVGDFSPPQEMRRSMRSFPQLTRNAFIPYGYPWRAFNSFLLRGLINLAVTDSLEKRDGFAFTSRFLRGSERVTYPRLSPLYKEKRQEGDSLICESLRLFSESTSSIWLIPVQ